MRRITRHACEDAPIPEEQETEGQRQLHSLLLQQLDTGADIERCVAKRKCFAPAALYKPFGDQAAGVKSLSQFRALQESEQELASLRELGLTEQEMGLWRNRDVAEPGGRSGRILLAPGARQHRLEVIRDKLEARERLLSLPQRLSASRALSRREMEIERALFHGNERQSFLSALYHQEDASECAEGSSSSDCMDQLYRDILIDEELSVRSERKSLSVSPPEPDSSCVDRLSPISDPLPTDTQTWDSSGSDPLDPSRTGHTQGGGAPTSRPRNIIASQPIRSLDSMGRSGGPLRVSGPVEQISEEQIRANKETEEEIRCIPRFQSYQRGDPSKVLCVKNLSARASLAQLASLFSRFQPPHGPPLLYRLLTGRLKGQAFITFSDAQMAAAALELLNGYRLLDKPLVIEFGREKKEEQRERGGYTERGLKRQRERGMNSERDGEVPHTVGSGTEILGCSTGEPSSSRENSP